MVFVPSVTHKPTEAKQRSVTAAMEALATHDGVEERGAIFTRPEVVDFILDLAGYTEDQPLHKRRLLEPSFGGGDFLLPIVGRLLTAWRVAKSQRRAQSLLRRMKTSGAMRFALRQAQDRLIAPYSTAVCFSSFNH